MIPTDQDSPRFWKTALTRPIVSLYLPLWVINVMGGTDAPWGYAASIAMFLVFVAAPILGAMSDEAGRRMPFLMFCTIVCVIFATALGMGGLISTLVFYIIANYFFQAGLIFYDSTLSVVSTPKNARGCQGIWHLVPRVIRGCCHRTVPS